MSDIGNYFSKERLKSIGERAKDVLLKPKETFELIKGEFVTAQDLILGYIAILAIIPAVASLIGICAVGVPVGWMGRARVPFGIGLTRVIVQYVLTIAGVYILSLIINAFAPNFSGVKNNIAALKVAVYSSTPLLVAGILYIIPSLGILVFIIGLYGLYLLYVAIPIMMECPPEKALGYTVLVIVAYIIIYIIIGVIAGAITQTSTGGLRI